MPRSRSTASRATRPRPKPARTAPAAVRTVEAVGSSTRSWDAAVTDAVRSAKDEAPEPIAVEVGRLWADLDAKGGIRRYRAAVKVAYRQPLVASSGPSVDSVDIAGPKRARSRPRGRARRS